MTHARKVIAAVSGLVAATLLMSGCAAVQKLLNEVPLDVPQPSLPATAEPLEKTYDGGQTLADAGSQDWAKKSKRRITAVGAAHKILVYSVEPTAGNDLTVRIKGDPGDAQLLADVEDYVVPAALKRAQSVTVIIDPSLCGIVGSVKDDNPVCDALTGN
jgi:hypothetical protein